MLQKLTHEIYFSWWMPALLPKLMLRGEAMQVINCQVTKQLFNKQLSCKLMPQQALINHLSPL